MPCETFVSIANFLQVTPDPHPSRILQEMPTVYRKVTRFDRGRVSHDLYRVLMRYRDAKASDERDRIYALIGLVNLDERFMPLVVDYTQSEEELVRRVAAHICRCDAECLPPHAVTPTVAAFLSNLDILRCAALAYLVRCTHHRADDDVLCMLTLSWDEHIKITPAMIHDASLNPVYAQRMSDLPKRFAFPAETFRSHEPIEARTFELGQS